MYRKLASAVAECSTIQTILTCSVLLTVLASFAPISAQSQGFPQRVFGSGERVMTLSDGDGRKSRVAYHQGYLYTADQNERMVRIWDISNENSPSIVRTFNNVGGSHGYGRSGDVIVFSPSAGFRATAANPSNPERFQFTRSLGSDREFYYPWMLTHHDGYGSPSGRLQLGDGRTGEVFSNPDPLGEAGVAGKAIMIGNLLIYASLHSTSGVATYDISDPRNPILLDSLDNIGAYEPAVFGHFLTMAVGFNNQDLHGGGNFNRGVTIVDFSDPSNLRVVGRIEDDVLAGDHRYMQFKDEFMFVGRNKVDMNTRQVVEQFDTSNELVDFLLPIGHLVALGLQINGETEVFAHQNGLDTRPPEVAYHLPEDGAVNQALSSRIGIIIHETLDTTTLVSGSTLIVRPVGGQAIGGTVFVSDMDIITFTPDSPLLPDTTYEVVLPAGGVTDVAGNAMERYAFRFATGNSVDNGNRPPTANQLQASSYPAGIGQSVQLSIAASDPDGDALEYRFDFGDGSAQTPWTGSSSVNHTYNSAGHFRAQVQVRDPSEAAVVRTSVVTVINPPARPGATNSSPIILDTDSRRVWTVNPDNDSVTAVDADSLQTVFIARVGDDPRALARSSDGQIWVTAQGSDRIDILDETDGTTLHTIDLPYGSAPYGIAFSAGGSDAFVSLEGRGELLRIDPTSRQITGRLWLGPHARSLAISDDGARVFVTRFNSPQTHGVVWDVDAISMSLLNTIRLAKDPGPDSDLGGRGVPNYLAGIAIHPDGERVWVASKKDNVDRGDFKEGNDLTFENTVRTILSSIDVTTGREVLNERIDSDNNDSLVAIEFSTLGDYAFAAVQGTNRVEIIDTFDNTRVTQIDTGAAPQGLRLDPATGRLFIKDFLGRSVTVYEMRPFLQRGNISFQSPTVVPTVTAETLSEQQLQGKRVFYHAGDTRMSRDGYLSCASCHVDGDSDGRVWDFTGRGEGLRNTIGLRGKAGTAQGRVHWSANFDEIQDFENDIRAAFGGTGFMPDAEFAARENPLGLGKAGVSSELDALAAYVNSLTEYGRSPYRNVDGSLTQNGRQGRALFTSLGCAQCHAGPDFTDSSVAGLHDVGTIKPGSGKRIGAPLVGIDTPSLAGLWQTAPYLHDGSAATVADVFTAQNRNNRHGVTSNLSATQRQQLAAFLLQIDDREPEVQPLPEPPKPANLLKNASFESGLSVWRNGVSGTAQADFSVDAGDAVDGQNSLRVDVNVVDDTPWHVQLIQGELNIVAGESYRLGFDIKSSQPGSIDANVMQDNDPWGNLGFSTAVDTNSQWQRHNFEFTATGSDSDARVGIDLGRLAGRSFWLDNFVLAPVSDNGGEITISMQDVSVSESAGSASVNVDLSRVSNEPVTVTAFSRAAGGTATPGADFYGFSEQIRFATGVTRQTIPVIILDDTQAESDETLSVRLSDASGAKIADDASATVTIRDDDSGGGSSKLSVANQSFAEDIGVARVLVTLAPPSTSAVTVTAFTRASGSATPGQDLYGASAELRFAAGETRKFLQVEILDDQLAEGVETIEVRLANASGAEVAKDNAVISINDNDSNAGQLSIEDIRVTESTGKASVKVSLAPAASRAVSVTAFTRPTGSALPGQDFYGTTQRLTFNAGETSKTLDVNILNDTAVESDETLQVRLRDATGASIARSTATVTISDDDSTDATLSVNSVTVNESDGTAAVRITLSRPVDANVTAYTSAGTAIGGGKDFFGFTRQVSFANGATVRTMNIRLNDDNAAESSETMTLRLTNARGAVIAKAAGTVTIEDDD